MERAEHQSENQAAEAEQKAVIEWFAARLGRDTPGGDLERVITHAAVVLLAGNRAYKIKRAVRYPYLDFSTPERRKSALERELLLNRRSAPALYRRVFSIKKDGAGVLLPLETVSGSPVEWVLEMERFDREQGLDRLALRGALGPDIIDRLAIVIGAFHRICEVRPDMGGAGEMERIVGLNTEQLIALALDLGTERLEALDRNSRRILARHRALLEQRRAAGFVRHCHGDLHLGNIVCIDGSPILFDCIEFDDRIACVDTLYDLAFLLMDLVHWKLQEVANRLLNGYLNAMLYSQYAPSLEGLALLPLFLSIRAAIRAHVEARRASGNLKTIREYIQIAEDMLLPARQSLIAIGGLSGSGKSTLARELAPHLGGPLGAVILRTDVLRKRMRGAALTDRLAETAYTASVTGAVYDEVMADARRVLDAGHSVILDAVFSREEERKAVRELAAAAGVPFRGIWLTAPYEDLAARLDSRKGDTSDATRAVLDRQCGYRIGEMDWVSIDTAPGTDNTLRRARSLVEAD